MELLAIPGSLRSASSNRALLEAGAALAPEGVTVRLSDHLAALPHFNPELDGPARPPAAAAWAAAVGAADGLLISTPEYAHGLPGAFKNGLDWLVSDPAMLGKPVAIWRVSPRGEHAHASLIEILTTRSMQLVAEASVTLPLLNAPPDLATLLGTPALSGPLREALAAFARVIREQAGKGTP
jgi:chromate reductase, NAD(P)H dehydrogenase (quinone)